MHSNKILNNIRKMSSVTAAMATTLAQEIPKSFTFSTVDYIVFFIMLTVSAGIGVYFGFFSKSKNTTDEYLMGSKKMKTLPIAISLIARLVRVNGKKRNPF